MGYAYHQPPTQVFRFRKEVHRDKSCYTHPH
jgi:hypothetical protein